MDLIYCSVLSSSRSWEGWGKGEVEGGIVILASYKFHFITYHEDPSNKLIHLMLLCEVLRLLYKQTLTLVECFNFAYTLYSDVLEIFNSKKQINTILLS